VGGRTCKAGRGVSRSQAQKAREQRRQERRERKEKRRQEKKLKKEKKRMEKERRQKEAGTQSSSHAELTPDRRTPRARLPRRPRRYVLCVVEVNIYVKRCAIPLPSISPRAQSSSQEDKPKGILCVRRVWLAHLRSGEAQGARQ
jgi:hypothetical protein